MVEDEIKAGERGMGSTPMTLKNLVNLPLYLARGVRYHAAGHFYTPKPWQASLRVTGRCNSRCVMCSEWKKGDNVRDLSLAEIGEIFGNPLFDSLEKLALSGGEPTLREDLVQIAEIILQCCPQIKEMSLLTNGLEPDLVEQQVKGLLALPRVGRLNKFAVSVSLDGYGDVHEKIRRVPRAFERVSETIQRLKELQREMPFYLCSTCVVQPLNLGNLVQLLDYCQEQELPVVLSPVCVSDIFVGDAASQNALKFTKDQVQELKIFVEGQFKYRLMPSNLPFWREYFSIVGGEKRKLPCHLCYHGVSVGNSGMLSLCSADSSLAYGSVLDTPPDELWYSEKAKETRRRAKKYYCPSCAICCDLAFCFSQEFFYYAGFLLKEKVKNLLRK